MPTAEAARIRAELARYAWWLDECIRIPGTGWRIGLDGLVGLIPGVGDVAATAAGLALIARARRLGASGQIQRKMLVNLGIDFVVGLVPLAGDLFDFAWKANRRNLDLLRAQWPEPTPQPHRDNRTRNAWLAVIGVIIAIALVGWLVR